MKNKKTKTILITSFLIILQITLILITNTISSYETTANNKVIEGTISKRQGKQVSVNFNSNGGTPLSFEEKDVRVNDTYGNLPTTSKEDYTVVGWRVNTLPIEYEEMDYIHFNTGNYIDLELIPTNHEVDIKFDYETYTSDEFLFGTSQGSQYFYTSAYNNKYAFGHDGNMSWTGYGTWTTGDHHLIYNGDNNEIIMDDELFESGNGISATTNLWLGRRGSDANLNGKIYYVKITDKETGKLVRNLIPCYRKSDEVIGMYDLVNDVFYTNKGTSNFTKGNTINIITSTSRVTIEDNHTLYAIWGYSPKVTLDSNGGNLANTTREYNYDSNYGNLPSVTKAGYTFMGWSPYLMPDEYQEVEYIKFNSGNYIDTGIIPTNHKLEIEFDYLTYTSDEFLFGTSQGSGYYYTAGYSNKYVFGHDGNMSWTGYGTWTTGDHHLIYNDNNHKIILDGETLEEGNNISASTTLWLGKRDSTANLNGKIYYVKITDKPTGKLVRYLIPCYRKTDNVIGMYDVINQVFYINNGSGTFEKGKDKVFIDNIEYVNKDSKLVENFDHTLYALWGNNPEVTFDPKGGTVTPSSKTYTYNSNYTDLPTPTKEGYTFKGWKYGVYNGLDYITTTGTEYIDTNYALWKDPNWKIEMKFEVSQHYNYNNMLGSLGTTKTSNEIWIDSSGNYKIRFNDSSATTITQISLNTPYTIIHDNTGQSLLNYVNGELVKTTSRANTSFNYKLGFAHREGSQYLKGKIYYLKFYSNGELIRNLRPTYRITDNTVGMYDLVENKFFPNAGTNDFGKGNTTNTGYDFISVDSNTKMITNKDHTLYAVW